MAPTSNTEPGTEFPGTPIPPAPSTSGFIEAGALRLHYLDYGTAGRPPMLCLHGGAAHAHWFDFVAADFNADYHLYSLDLRGHGDSAWSDPPQYSFERFASDLAEVVDKLDLRDFVLAGHSMGGTVALVYAATYPGRVSKLIIVDSNLKDTEDSAARLRDFSTKESTNYATREELVARYRLRPNGSRATPDIIRHIAHQGATQTNDGRWQHKFDRKIHFNRPLFDSMGYWARIRVPVLVIKGDLSLRLTPQIFAEVKARCPHAELAEVANSDHHVMLDNPRGYARAVKAFLAEHDSEGSTHSVLDASGPVIR